MHEIPSVSLHLQIGKNGFLFSNGFIGVIAYGFLPDLLIAILIAHLSLNHWLAFTFSATYQRHVRDLNPRDFYIQTVFKTAPSTNRTHGKYSGCSVTATLEIAFVTTLCNFMRTFYRLRQTFSQVYCRKLAQIQGLEPWQRFYSLERLVISCDTITPYLHSRAVSVFYLLHTTPSARFFLSAVSAIFWMATAQSSSLC